MTVVEEYWRGVLQRLQAEVNVFARLIQHHGEQGRESESAFARVLESFMPQRLGVGTGMVIDREGRSSRQMDIVLFDRADEPAVLAQTNQLLYPVENVIGAIEVKTRLSTTQIDRCGDVRRSIAELEPARSYPDDSRHPVFAVLAYTTEVAFDTTLQAFAEMGDDGRPDLVCVLDPALIVARPADLKLAHEAEYHAGLALLPDAQDETGWRRVARTASMSEPVGTQLHRLVRRPGDDAYYLADSARALLLFVETFARLMALKQGREEPAVTSYLNDEARKLAWL